MIHATLDIARGLGETVPPPPVYVAPPLYPRHDCPPWDTACLAHQYCLAEINNILIKNANLDYDRSVCERNNALNINAGYPQNARDCASLYPPIPVPDPSQCASYEQAYLSWQPNVEQPTPLEVLQAATATYKAAGEQTAPVATATPSASATQSSATQPTSTAAPATAPPTTTQPATATPQASATEQIQQAASEAWQLIGDATARFTDSPVVSRLVDTVQTAGATLPWWAWLVIAALAYQLLDRNQRK